MHGTTQMLFVLAAYLAGATVIAGLSAWVALDYRVQLRRLSSLNQRGITRRSVRSRPLPAKQA